MKFWNKKIWRTFSTREIGMPLPVVGDAAIGIGAIGEGRLIPLVIVDASARPALEELIRVHQFTQPGDVVSQWGAINGDNERISLFLNFKRPSELDVVIEFSVNDRAPLIDQILTTKSMYLQVGKHGDRFINTQSSPRILMEIPETGFKEVWEKIYYRYTYKKFRANGLNRQLARKAAHQFISETRKFGDTRVSSK